jgi:DNA-binding transcriptional LysR family regulator
MELARLDLNMLLVFHHLLREKRVSAVATALDGLQQALNVRASFNPSTSQRSFTLAMTDVGEMYFLPVLMDALAQSAPGVTLNVVAVTSASLGADMASGRTDLALGLLPQLQAGFFQQALFRQPCARDCNRYWPWQGR